MLLIHLQPARSIFLNGVATYRGFSKSGPLCSKILCILSGAKVLVVFHALCHLCKISPKNECKGAWVFSKSIPGRALAMGILKFADSGSYTGQVLFFSFYSSSFCVLVFRSELADKKDRRPASGSKCKD